MTPLERLAESDVPHVKVNSILDNFDSLTDEYHSVFANFEKV